MAGILVASLVLVLAACGGDNSEPTTTPAAGVAPTVTTLVSTATSPGAVATTPPAATSQAGSTPVASDTAAIEATTLQIFDAIRQHDRDRLHDITGDHLRENLREQDMDHLASCIPEGTTISVVDQKVEVAGDTATVTITLELTTADGTKTTVDRTWSFEKDADGVWRLSELPECPLR